MTELPATQAELTKRFNAVRLAYRRQLARELVALMPQYKSAGVQAGIWAAATYLDPRKTAFQEKKEK